MKFYLVIAFALITGIALGQAGSKDNPGSLWTQSQSDPLSDRVAKKEGDIITILVNETSTSSYTAQTTGSKADSTSVSKGIGPLLANLIPNLGIGASSSNSGSGSTSQTGQFTATITAVIKKVLPNGQFLIEGTRSIQTNKDTQIFKLSGMIRRDDIRSDNTILSTSIANATITGSGKGMIADRQRRGILTRLLDWLF